MKRRWSLVWVVGLVVCLGLLGSPGRDGQAVAGIDYLESWSFTAYNTGAEFGYSVSPAGDVNGDGYADVLIGARKDTLHVYREGVVYLFYGSPAGLVSTPVWKMGSGQQGAAWGQVVAPAGDVNDDGFDDVLIGAPAYKADQAPVGGVFLFLGSANGLANTPDWQVIGEQPDAELGCAASPAGDVNGDGFDDIIIGAQWFTVGQESVGQALVYHGGADGPGQTPAWVVTGDQPGGGFGHAASGAGDVNGDGFGDVVVAAHQYDDDEEDEGAVFVFYGATTGLATSAAWQMVGDQAGATFGAAAAPAGDVNGDGFGDVVVGAPLYDGQEEDEGAAYLFHGGAAGLSMAANWLVLGGSPGVYLGQTVASAGDVNQDGYAEVVVGAPLSGDDQPEEGVVWVYVGSMAGLSPLPGWHGEGNKAEARFGWAAAPAGDVNRDGYDDLVVGAPLYKVEHVVVGQALLFLGQPGSNLPPVLYLPVMRGQE